MSRSSRRILVLLAAPLAWVGCFSDSSGGGGPAPQFDGSLDAAFDGTEPETSVPESSVDSSVDASVDSAVPEAAIDSAVDAGAEATVDAGMPVVVTVVGAAGPEPGVIIVYDDPTGAYVAMQTTDASGRASMVVAAGSMVTALLGSPTTYSSPFTIMGVEPGDALTVVDWGSLPSSDQGTRAECTTVNVTEQAAPLANTAFYLASSGLVRAPTVTKLPSTVALGGQCGGPSTPAAGPPSSIELGASIAAGQPKVPVLLEAFDNGDNQLGYLFDKASALPSSAAGADAATGQVTLAGAWSTTYTNQTLDITNVPDAGLSYTPILSEVVSGTLTTDPQYFTPFGNTFFTHPGFADFIQVEASSTVYFQSGQAMAMTLPAPTGDATIPMDLTPLASMPVLSGTSVDTTNPARPTFTWTTSSGSLSTVTGIVVFASFSGAGGDGGNTSGNWTIVAPAQAQASLTAPELPGSLGAWIAPSTGFTGGNNVEIWGLQGTALPTYAAVRAAASAFTEQPACNINAPIVPALPTVGTNLMVTMYSNAFCG
jgi:hypothetical protein